MNRGQLARRWGARGTLAVAATSMTLACAPPPRAPSHDSVAGRDVEAPPPLSRAARALALRDAAALASSRGAYGFAIAALARAHALTPDEDTLYRLARAYQQRHRVEGDGADGVRALRRHREVVATSSGRHLAAARRAVAELEAQLGAHASDPLRTDAEGAGTWIAISASVLGAEVRLDGGPPAPSPQFLAVRPGAHGVVVGAPEHHDRAQTVEIGDGEIVLVDAALTPRSALLRIEGVDTATLHLDGRDVGVVGADPREVEPGPHFVVVSANGHHPVSRRVEAARGTTTTLPIDLPATTQRLVAWPTLSLGGAGLTASIVLGALAVIEQRDARAFAAAAGTEGLSDADQSTYDALLAHRDRLALAATGAGFAGLALTAVGGALFVLDAPPLPAWGPVPPAPAPSRREGSVEVRPLSGAGGLGLGVTLVRSF